ncbi:MAG TPA: hypothetical protein VJ852_06240 [Gemmatimonadaceae bacterium]|nr:hypothetical protein [Gemmatimonadaceae bacterium]
MQNKDGFQKGPQHHAEGQHGSKTHSKFIETLHTRMNDDHVAGDAPTSDEPRHHIAKHNSTPRLFGDRQQHDEAEKKSEKTRLHRELERRGQDDEEFLPGTG